MASLLDLDAFGSVGLTRDPFPFVIVPGFVRRETQPALDADFPRIARAGSFPVSELACGPAFARLVAELSGPELETAVAAKFGVDLAGRSTMVTVRGRCRRKDGRIHTDTASKIISVLVYLNDGWRDEGGRLRLLRRADDLDDVVAEVPQEWGTLVAFRRTHNSFHGHRPFEGERRVVQLNWVTDHAVVEREQRRHRLTARIKRLLPWLGGY